MPESFTLFWHGPFSQWYIRPFTDEGYQHCFGLTFNCCEQYMMFRKARFFEDGEAADLIMETTHPRDQKKAGRGVRNFDKARWEEEAQRIVYWGNFLKFSQHADLREQLLATAGTTLVEASPRDRIWGIGLGADNPLAQSRATWRGKNWLGECLTLVRDDLLEKRRMDEIFANLGID